VGAGGEVVSLFCPGGPVCVWFWSPTPLPGLVAGGACTGAAGTGGFDVGFDRAGVGAGGGEAVVSRLGAGAGADAGAGGGGGAGAGAGVGTGAGAEIGSGAAACGAAVPVGGSTVVRTTTTGADGERRGETTARGAACSPGAGAGSTVAGTTVCATTGGAATRTAWSPLWPTSVPGRPIAAVMAPSPAAAATIRDQPPLMLEPPSAEQPRSDLIGSGGRNLKDNE
jgi:hypothetical protein